MMSRSIISPFVIFGIASGLIAGCDATLRSVDPSSAHALSDLEDAGVGGAPDPDANGTSDREGVDEIDTGPDPALCEIAPTQVRMLTNEHYDNTVRDLLGTSQTFSAGFPGEPVVGGFDNNAEALSVNARLVEEYAAAAEALSREAGKNVESLMPCDSEKPRCVRRFIREFGRRAFRRPLKVAEVDNYFAIFESGTEFNFESGIEFVVHTMLQSPSFIYNIETADDEGRLDAFALASKLSYFLWNSMPDDELLDAAESGALHDPEEFARQAERMVNDERSHVSIRNFIRQWLKLDGFELLTKDTNRYPEYSEELRGLWEEQIYRFAEEAMISGGGLEELLTGNYTFVNDELAALYDLPAPGSDELTRIELPAGRVGGILGQPGLMALHAHDLPSVFRGLFVVSELLCRAPPPPPDNLEIPVVEPEGLTLRDYTDALTMQGSCAVCHSLMNPYGHALGQFDTLGRPTTTDSYGFEVNAAVELPLDGELVSVDGAAELTEAVVDSQELRQCFVRKWYRYAASRLETRADACSLDELIQDFDGDVRSLLLNIVTDTSFTHGVSR